MAKKRKDPELDALVARIRELNQRAAELFSPVVEEVIGSGRCDTGEFEHLLDNLLGFCGYPATLALFHRLCRHLSDIDPEAAACYVRHYREMWDCDEEAEPPAP